MRYCQQCGSPVSGAERFCANCGARMPEPVAEPSPGSPTISPAKPARRGGLVAVIGIVAIAIIGIGIAFMLVRRPAIVIAPEPTATATAPVTQPTTPPALSSPTAAQPLATVVGGIAVATPGGAASIAQTAQAGTAQALREIAPTQTAAALAAEAAELFQRSRRIFYDTFVDNRNAWYTGVFQEIELDLIEDGVFKVLWSGRGTSYEVYELSSFTSFIAEVDCRIARGGGDGSCGLIFGQRQNVGFYKFEFFIDYYRLSVIAADRDPVLLAEGDPRQITQIGDFNRLRVIREGDRIRLFVNDTLLNDLRDDTYPSGRIGVSTTCYREEGGVEIHFDNFGIWTLPEES